MEQASTLLESLKKYKLHIIVPTLFILVVLIVFLTRSPRVAQPGVPPATDMTSVTVTGEESGTSQTAPASKLEAPPEARPAAKPDAESASQTKPKPEPVVTAKQVMEEYKAASRIKDPAKRLAATESLISKYKDIKNPAMAEIVVATMQLKVRLVKGSARLAVYDEILERHPSSKGLKDSFIAKLGRTKLDKAMFIKNRTEKIRLAEQVSDENESSEFLDRRVLFAQANNFLAALADENGKKSSYYDKVVAIPLTTRSHPRLMTVVAIAMNGKAMLVDRDTKIAWLAYIVENFDGRDNAWLDEQVLVAKLEWAKMLPRDDALQVYEQILLQYEKSSSSGIRKKVGQAVKEKQLLEAMR